MNSDSLHNQALEHRAAHDCSAYPYEHGEKLVQAVQNHNAKQILEIGTGIGYTAVVMALASPLAQIDTLEKDLEHAQLARELVESQGLSNRIEIIEQSAEEYLPTTQKSYDFIFFDGYQIHYEFLPQYQRLLKSSGILFLANNHLASKTSEQFFSELKNPNAWKILEQFADTTIAQRI